MNITWHGLSCIRITTKNISGDASVLINPFEPMGKYKIPKSPQDIVLVSEKESKQHNATKAVAGDPLVVDIPGEYESKEVLMRVVSVEPDNVDRSILSVTSEGINVVVITAMNGECTDAQLDSIGQTDVLIVTAGDKDRLKVELVEKLMSQLSPRVIIPMQYQLKGWPTKLQSSDACISKVGLTPTGTVEKYKILRKDLPAEDTQLIILSG